MKKEDGRKNNTAIHLQPFQWKAGQSGNPKGRKAGKSMKDYAREILSKFTEEERKEFLMGLPKDIIWRMAEGNPAQDAETKIKIDIPLPILDVKEMKALPVDSTDKMLSDDIDEPPSPSFNKESNSGQNASIFGCILSRSINWRFFLTLAS